MISKHWFLGLFWVPLIAAFAQADSYDQYFNKKREWYSSLPLNGLSQTAYRAKEDQAEKELNPMLRSLIGDTVFRESAIGNKLQPGSRGAGSTDTGCVDGVHYDFKSSGYVVVSDAEIVKRWALFWEEKLKSPLHLKELSAYSTDFACGDAHHTNMGDLDLPPQKGFDAVYGSIEYVNNDIGPGSPNAIDIYARKGEKLFFMTFEIDSAQTVIQKCHQLWTDADPKGDVEEEPVFKRMAECYQKSYPQSALQEHFRKLALERFTQLL